MTDRIEEARESAWLVEREKPGHGQRYLCRCGESRLFDWGPISRALRLSRREDAEEMLTAGEDVAEEFALGPARATEHEWVPPHRVSKSSSGEDNPNPSPPAHAAVISKMEIAEWPTVEEWEALEACIDADECTGNRRSAREAFRKLNAHAAVKQRDRNLQRAQEIVGLADKDELSVVIVKDCLDAATDEGRIRERDRSAERIEKLSARADARLSDIQKLEDELAEAKDIERRYALVTAQLRPYLGERVELPEDVVPELLVVVAAARAWRAADIAPNTPDRGRPLLDALADAVDGIKPGASG